MTKKNITFLTATAVSEKSCKFTDEESVLEVALKNGIEIPHSCGAMGSCTTCRVLIVSSPKPLPERNELEQDIADMRGFTDEERLSCQLPPIADLVLRIPDTREGDALT